MRVCTPLIRVTHIFHIYEVCRLLNTLRAVKAPTRTRRSENAILKMPEEQWGDISSVCKWCSAVKSWRLVMMGTRASSFNVESNVSGASDARVVRRGILSRRRVVKLDESAASDSRPLTAPLPQVSTGAHASP